MLAGMFRVRQLTQDDSHVFCRDDQVDDELRLALSLVRKQYAPFGFEPRAKLATRPEKRLGSDEFWERAEERLRERLDEDGMAYTLDEGGGAFYAPKIDIFIEDALGREWQMATIQADYQLPQRFDLEYRAADGGFERPVVIHYAIYGSFERFIGIITEHYTGAFPFWLAPVQVMIVPIADRHLEYAESVRVRRWSRPACGPRSTTDPSGCSSSCATPRSRRSRSWSWSAIGTPRRAPSRRACEPASRRRAWRSTSSSPTSSPGRVPRAVAGRRRGGSASRLLGARR